MPERATHVWYQPGEAFGRGLRAVTAWWNDEHPDGAVVDADTAPIDSDEQPLWHISASDSGLAQLSLAAAAAPAAPATMWFVIVPELTAKPAAMNLVAFGSDSVPAGTYLSHYAFPGLRVANDEQLGAVRWYPKQGLIHQIFVAPTARRQQVGTAMLYAVDAWHQANSWPARLRSDGRRTELGEKFTAGLRHPQRIAPWTEAMPPMDPPVRGES